MPRMRWIPYWRGNDGGCGHGQFINPRTPIDVLEGIESYMKANKIDDIHEIIGSLKT